MKTDVEPKPLPELRMSERTANSFATNAADRDRRPYSLWPSKRLVTPFYRPLSPAAYTGLTLGGHTS